MDFSSFILKMNYMEELMKKYNITIQAKIINTCAASMMFITGIIIAIFMNMEENALKIIVGCMCILMGLAKVLGYFSNDIYRLAFQHDLAVGALNIILGILSFTLKGAVKDTICTSIGVYVILDSLLKVQTGIDAKNFGMKGWKGILISSASVVVVGVLALMSPHQFTLPLNISIGAAMVANATLNAWITMYSVRVRAKKKSFKVDIDLGE